MRRLKKPYGQTIARYYLLLCCVLLPALAWAQQGTYSIRLERVNLEQALVRIRAVTGASIAFNREEVKGIDVGPVSYKAQTVEQILKGLLPEHAFTIERRGEAWLVKKSAAPPPAAAQASLPDTSDETYNGKTSALNEVVVLGFGQTQKRMAQTGAIASITSKEIKQSPVSNIANALAGRLPGLITVQRSGQPGADMPELYIRGIATLNSSAPLLTIDGIQKESNALSLLDPNEIESITILKDASATALYGVKGANGVIIVSTKRGKIGAPTVNASVQTSVQSPTKLPQYLDSYNFAVLANEAYRNDNPNGTTIPYSDADLAGYKAGTDPYRYPNVDWLNEMLQPARMTRADFNVSGGNKMVRYFTNIGYVDQKGLYKAEKNSQYDPNLDYKRYNFRSNIDINVDKDFSIGLSLFGAIEDKDSANISTTDLFDFLLKEPPNAFPIRYPTGVYGGTNRSNPFQLLN
ncbi:MAG TPA: TonB-dependent receptor plug domain-containing protein, partial [Chitinophaga sp.]